MRLFDENLLKTATLSATYIDANYPLVNLYDNSLLTLCQTEDTETTTTITLDFTTDQTVSYFAIGPHNCSEVEVKLYDSTPALLDTYTYTDSGAFRKYPSTPETTVQSIEIKLTTVGDYISVGHIGLGSFIQFPGANINPSIGHSLTGSYSKTTGGYLTGKKGVKLESFDATFDIVTLVFQGELFTAIEELQGNTAFYLDRYEESISDYPILWANLTNLSYEMTKIKAGTQIDGLTMTFEECK